MFDLIDTPFSYTFSSSFPSYIDVFLPLLFICFFVTGFLVFLFAIVLVRAHCVQQAMLANLANALKWKDLLAAMMAFFDPADTRIHKLQADISSE